MKIWAISDSHGHHHDYTIPEDIDLVIHAGDSTNQLDFSKNNTEFISFIDWFDGLKIKHKILVPGNHDTWATKKYNVDNVKEMGINLLIHEHLILEGIKFFGSPYTPTFMNWNFMVPRHKLSRYWEAVDEDVDVLITHGPPKGILDLSHDKSHKLEFCGDSALRKLVDKINPVYHIFGHIHDSSGCTNSGIFKASEDNTLFMNVSCVEDGKFGQGLKSFGQIFEITGPSNKKTLPHDFKETTGWDTMEEYEAYEKGREHEQKVTWDWINKWDGKTNSGMGRLLFDKMKEIFDKHT